MNRFHARSEREQGIGRPWRRPIPVISRRLEHVADVDPDDLDAVLETGEFELRVSLNNRAYLIPKAASD